MTKLPVPYAFDMSDTDLQDSVESLLRRVEVRARMEQAALRSLAFEIGAQRHFMRRVERIPKDKLEKIAFSVAQCLARAARLTRDGHLEVRQSLTAMAEDAKMAFATFDERLAILVNLGLIEIIKRGSRNGHPFHIRLCIRSEHHEQITEQARKSILEHFSIRSSRFSLSESTSS